MYLSPFFSWKATYLLFSEIFSFIYILSICLFLEKEHYPLTVHNQETQKLLFELESYLLTIFRKLFIYLYSINLFIFGKRTQPMTVHNQETQK